jgi:molecular chaperone GrpE
MEGYQMQTNTENSEKEGCEQTKNGQNTPANEFSAEETAADTAEQTEAVADQEAAPDSEEIIAKLTEENAELNDRLLRKAAEFDNYRKRMIREKQEAFDYANAALLGDLLDSLDNFDRALDAASQTTDIKTVVLGIQMIKKQLVSMLETKYNMTGYGEPGDLFNPDEHEALTSVPGKVAEPVLAEVYLKGYKLKDRVIRHAKVMVNMPE